MAQNLGDGVLDHGLETSHFVLVHHADPHKETQFNISPDVLAQSAGVNPKDPCMYASSLEHMTVQSVTAPHHTGIVFKSGDKPVGNVHHPTFTHLSEHETGGYHAVASKGPNDYGPGLQISLKDPNHEASSDPYQFIKRAGRWSGEVGKTAEQLVAGLESHDGTDSRGNAVSRVLVPVHGDHACTRALALNQEATEGPFAHYNMRNRQTITTPTGPHVVVEKDHLMNIAKVLETNLKPSTQMGQHGISVHFKPLPNQKASAQAGKVVVKFKIDRKPTHRLLQPDDQNGGLSARVTIRDAQSVLNAGGSHALPSPDEASKQAAKLSNKILNMKISGSTPTAAAMPSQATVTTLADGVGADSVHIIDDDANE